MVRTVSFINKLQQNTNFKIRLLLCLVIGLAGKTSVFAQDILEIDKSKLDTSKKSIRSITRLSEYYIEQLKKKKLPQAEFDAAREYLFNAELELKEIDKIRINNSKFKLDRAFMIEAKKERDAKLTELVDMPQGYFSSEEKSLTVGAFVGITGAKYTKPVCLLVEYHPAKNWSAGVWIGYFMEQVQIINHFDDPKKSWYSVGEKNYKFDYITTGVQGKYRFFNPKAPWLGLPVRHFHFYVAAAVGFNIVVGPKDLQNITDIKNNPSRAGLAYGLWPGLHYQMDENLGFDLEAGYGNLGLVKLGLNWRLFLEKEKPEEIKGRNTSFIE